MKRKLILFGLIQELLRKINKYPISLNSQPSDSSKFRFPGDFNYDKICSENGISIQKIEEHLDQDPNVIICIK